MLHVSDTTSKIRSVTRTKKNEIVVRVLNDHLHQFTSHHCQTEEYLRKSHCQHVIGPFIPEDRNTVCIYLFTTF